MKQPSTLARKGPVRAVNLIEIRVFLYFSVLTFTWWTSHHNALARVSKSRVAGFRSDLQRFAFGCSEKNLCELCALAPLRELRPAWESSRKGAKAQSSQKALWKAGALLEQASRNRR